MLHHVEVIRAGGRFCQLCQFVLEGEIFSADRVRTRAGNGREGFRQFCQCIFDPRIFSWFEGKEGMERVSI